MNIGFDFDKVFIDAPPFLPESFVEFLYKGGSHFRKGKRSREFHYRIPSIIEQKVRIVSHYPIFRQPIQANINSLNAICDKKNVNLFLISSRFGFLRKQTETLMKKYKLDACFKKAYFNYQDLQPHIFKLDMINKLKIDMYIEDDLDLVLYLADRLPRLRIFWLSEKTTSIKLPKNATAISSLKEFRKFI